MDMSIDYLKNAIYKKCKIKTLENIPGVIISVWINAYGIQFEVRYYVNSKQECQYFLPEEITIL